MHLYAHAGIFAVPLTFALADAGAAAGATPVHYLAVGAVLIAIGTVIKGYDWAEHKVDDKVKSAIANAFRIHGAEDETRFEKLRGEIRSLAGNFSKRPCIARVDDDGDTVTLRGPPR